MQTKTCPNCGRVIPEDAITCKHCGTMFFNTGAGFGYGDVNRQPQPEQHEYAPEQPADQEYAEGDYGDYGDYDNYDEYNDHEGEQPEANYDVEAEDDGIKEPLSADARYRKIVIIVLSAIFALLIIVIVLLFITKNDTDFGQKNGSGAALTTRAPVSKSDESSSLLDTLTELDSSEADEDEDSELDESSEEDSSSDDESSEDDSSSKADGTLPDEYIPPQTTTTPAPETTTTTTTEPEATTTPAPTETEPPQTDPEPTDTEYPPLPE